MQQVSSRRTRPLSPHLQVYKFAWPMMFSIIQRISGALLVPAFGWLALWVCWAKLFPDTFHYLIAFHHNPLIVLVAIAAVWGLVYHWLCGLRYLFWDIGVGFSKTRARNSGILVVAVSLIVVALTVANVWRGL